MVTPEQKRFQRLLQQLWSSDNGQDIAEYALMLTLILLISVAAISSLGGVASNVFNNVTNRLLGQ